MPNFSPPSSVGFAGSSNTKSKATGKTSKKSSSSPEKKDSGESSYNSYLSYPTPVAIIFDVPEPEHLDGKFYYNYFFAVQ